MKILNYFYFIFEEIKETTILHIILVTIHLYLIEMKNKLSVLLIINMLAFSTMAQEPTMSNNELENLIQTVGDKYAPDRRVEVYSITTIESEDELSLKGETTNESAYKELLTKAKRIYPQIKDEIRILPDYVIGNHNWGVIYNSVADLRGKPTYSAEMVTQVLMGMPVKILDKSGSWHRIQTPEGYIGWMSGSVHRLTEMELKEYMAQPKIIITSQYAQSYTKADTQSQPVSDIVVGDMLCSKGAENNFYKTIYPDGREAFVEMKDAVEVEDWLKRIELSGENIVQTAKQLMGVPYVWGGTSAKGLDCSGYTKIVYWLHGIIIARDASQQVKNGVEIDSIGNFDNAQKGDLVFFGVKATDENPKERVVHVGIYIGNQEFIHASDYIHISSFNPESPIYDEYNANRYLRTMRYIGHEGTPGIIPIIEHPFYSKP